MKKLILFLLLFSPAVFADNDFYTYGGFESVESAFQRLAAIFNDPTYEYAIFAFAIGGVTIGYLITLGKGFLGGGAKGYDALVTLVLVGIGVTIYTVALKPTTTVHIYDETTNRYTSVGGVPSLVANLVSFPNVIEQGFTRMIDASSVYPRSEHANGKTLELLLNSLNGNPLAHNTYLNRSLYSYIETCMPPALNSPHYTFDLNKLLTDTTSVLTELEKTKSFSIPVVYYDETNKAGITLNCADAFDNIATLLTTSSTYERFTESLCKKSGFDVTNALQLTECRSRINSVNDMVFGAGNVGTDTNLFLSQAIAKSTFETLSNYAGSAVSDIANLREMAQGYGTVIVAEGWIPTIRSSTHVIILSVLPILVLFLVTPLIWKSLHLIITLFIFVSIWGVSDAIIHTIIVDQVQDMMSSLEDYKGSVSSLLMAPTEVNKGLATFGKLQSMGVILAAFLGATFFKLSARPFSMMGERLSENIEGMGERAGQEVLDPTQRFHMMDANAGAYAKENVFNRNGPALYQSTQGSLTTQPMLAEASYLQSTYDNGYNYEQALNHRAQSHGGAESGKVMTTAERASENNMSVSAYSQQISSTATNVSQATSEVDQRNIDNIGQNRDLNNFQLSNEFAEIIKASDTGRINASPNSSDHVEAANINSVQHLKDKLSYKAVAEEQNIDVGTKAFDESKLSHQMRAGEHSETQKVADENKLSGYELGGLKSRTETEGILATAKSRTLAADEQMADSTLDAAFRMEASQFLAFLAEHNLIEMLASSTGQTIAQGYQSTHGNANYAMTSDFAKSLLSSISTPQSEIDARQPYINQIEAIASGNSNEVRIPNNSDWEDLKSMGFVAMPPVGSSPEEIKAFYQSQPAVQVDQETGEWKVQLSPEQAREMVLSSNDKVKEFTQSNRNALEALALNGGGTFQANAALDLESETAAIVASSTHAGHNVRVDDSEHYTEKVSADMATLSDAILSEDLEKGKELVDRVSETEGNRRDASRVLTEFFLSHLSQVERDLEESTLHGGVVGELGISKGSLVDSVTSSSGASEVPLNKSQNEGKGSNIGKVLKAMPVDASIRGTAAYNGTSTDSTSSDFSVNVVETKINELLEGYSNTHRTTKDFEQLRADFLQLLDEDNKLAKNGAREFSNDEVNDLVDDRGPLEKIWDAAEEKREEFFQNFNNEDKER